MAEPTDHQTETFKSLISLSTEALKALQLLNGGAVVALLAYLGQASKRADLARALTCPFALFVAGLLAATLAYGSAYLTQLSLYSEDVQGAGFRGTKHQVWLWTTFAIALASLALFAFGAFASIAALTRV
jgi:hypothetical protein